MRKRTLFGTCSLSVMLPYLAMPLLCLAMPGQPEVDNVPRSQFEKKFTNNVQNIPECSASSAYIVTSSCLSTVFCLFVTRPSATVARHLGIDAGGGS